MSVVFICYGNACRSPMAEGLAKHLLGEDVWVESAGLAPILSGACDDAIEFLREQFDIDISHHMARSVANVQIGLFEHIVILDAYVYESLKKRYPSFMEKFILWDIEDPYGRDRKAFQNAAEKIKNLIDNKLIPLYSE